MEPNESFVPKWITVGLGTLLMLLVVLLIVQKGNDLKSTFKNTKPANTISVSAEGKVQATPDLATVTIGVMSQGTDSKTVKDQNDEKVNKIIDFIKQQGIDAKDITTTQFNFYPQQDWTNGQSRIVGYEGNQSVTVKVHGVDKDQTKLEAVLDGAINNGANNVQGVSFTFEDPDNMKQEARKLAISKAKEKAEELAREAGLTLGKVVSVSEGQGSYPTPMPYYTTDAVGMGGSEKSIAPNIEPGSQDLTQTMTVTFEVK